MYVAIYNGKDFSIPSTINTDKEQPKIACPTNHTQETDLGQPTAVVVWEAPNATDNSNETVNVSCFPTSGSKFGIGQREVECKAEDKSGNIATCQFHVNITGMYAI